METAKKGEGACGIVADMNCREKKKLKFDRSIIKKKRNKH